MWFSSDVLFLTCIASRVMMFIVGLLWNCCTPGLDTNSAAEHIDRMFCFPHASWHLEHTFKHVKAFMAWHSIHSTYLNEISLERSLLGRMGVPNTFPMRNRSLYPFFWSTMTIGLHPLARFIHFVSYRMHSIFPRFSSSPDKRLGGDSVLALFFVFFANYP